MSDVYGTARGRLRARLASPAAARTRARRHAQFFALTGLRPEMRVVDIGCGALGLRALEPGLDITGVDVQSRPQYPGPFVLADATQRLPFDDDAFDAVMATVTVHQWRDTAGGLAELRRVSRGPVGVLTFDGDELDRLWLAEYAPELMAAERRRYPAITTIAAAIGRTTDVLEVPIPIDCVDGFTEAYYARPEAFLDPQVRAAQSAWGFVTPGATDRAVDRLRSDLASGEWQRTYGQLLTQPQFGGSLRLLVGHP